MSLVAAAALTAGTLLNVVVSALVAGVGVTVAFSTVIYCADRASELRREHRGAAAAVMTASGVVALAACVALDVYGLVLITSKS